RRAKRDAGWHHAGTGPAPGPRRTGPPRRVAVGHDLRVHGPARRPAPGDPRVGRTQRRAQRRRVLRARTARLALQAQALSPAGGEGQMDRAPRRTAVACVVVASAVALLIAAPSDT